MNKIEKKFSRDMENILSCGVSSLDRARKIYQLAEQVIDSVRESLLLEAYRAGLGLIAKDITVRSLGDKKDSY